jgi:DNA-binding IclR family transcriptional regulator
MAARPRAARATDSGALVSSAYRIQVLDRTLRILDTLAADNSLKLAELARRLSLHKATAHRLLKVLELEGLVTKDPVLGKYKLGLKLFELGSRAIEQVDLRDSAEPFLRRLVSETRETAHISIPDGCHMVSIARVEAPWAMRSPSTLGRRTPVYCSSSGKAVLAFLPEDCLDELLRRLAFVAFTRNTITTRAAFVAELERIRRRGFAIDHEEMEIGLRCVGAPLFDHTGRVCAGISIAGPAFRLTDQRLPAIGRSVLEASRGLSKALGFPGTDACVVRGTPSTGHSALKPVAASPDWRASGRRPGRRHRSRRLPS